MLCCTSTSITDIARDALSHALIRECGTTDIIKQVIESFVVLKVWRVSWDYVA